MNAFIGKRTYNSSGLLEYYGQAEPGSLTSESKWTIIKYTYSGADETDKQYPGGDNANIYIWDNREGYTYS